MILVDTSIWIRKLGGREPFASELDQLLRQHRVAGHEMIHGELLIGGAPGRGSRAVLLEAFRNLPWLDRVAHDQVEAMVRARGLAGQGLGWIDAHLLASALAGGSALWTADAALMNAARAAGAAWDTM